MIRRTIYFLLVTLLLGGLAGVIAWYAFDFKPKFLAEVILGSPQPAATIAAEESRVEQWQPQVAGIGTLTASEGIDIAPQVGGVIRELNFDSGQDVTKGQLLVRLDTAQEEADLRSLEAQLMNAQDELDRRQGLADKGLAPKAEIVQLKSARDSLRANVDKTKATIKEKYIYAPWDGHVGLREISIGSYIAPGQKVVWLQKVDPMFADFAVTEADFGRIAKDQKVTAKFNAWPDKVFEGKVTTTDARMSDASRMITVRAEIPNPDHKLLPGMYADILVATGSPQQVVTVPQTAVTFTLYGDSVFVVVPASKLDPKAKPEELAVERRIIKSGEVRSGRVAIAEGLKAGEQIVTAGQNKIDQGSKVVINNSIALKAQESNSIQ